MNIVYDINPETGLMRLKFKDGLLNSLNGDNREAFDKYLLPLLAMNDKFVLTGSLSLKLLGFEPLDKVGDFDLGLTSAFTEEEFITVKISLVSSHHMEKNMVMNQIRKNLIQMLTYGSLVNIGMYLRIIF